MGPGRRINAAITRHNVRVVEGRLKRRPLVRPVSRRPRGAGWPLGSRRCGCVTALRAYGRSSVTNHNLCE